MLEKQRLDLLLVELGLAESQQKALAEIMAGNVLVNDEPVVKAGFQVRTDASIRLKEKFPYVSRGALKLLHALDYFHADVKGKVAVDIGASTGGFTQVLLERGAVKVYAVDSGTNQLDWKLRGDARVVPMENSSARFIDQLIFDPRPEVAVMDVSFISITKILRPLTQILVPGFQIITLIKPQFELEKAKVGDRGLVAPEFRDEAVQTVLNYAISIGLKHSEVIESPITGAKSGNVEYLVQFTRP